MSKESIQEVVQKSLEEYFNDLGEQQASNIYDMVVLTVEKPILEVVMQRADGNQSHAAQMLGINRNTLRKKLQEHGLLYTCRRRVVARSARATPRGPHDRISTINGPLP